MFKLEKSLIAWGTPDFASVLKQEVVRFAHHLPLQQGLASGNYVADTPLTLLIQSVVGEEKAIRVKAGILYQGIIGGCSCSDDPTTASETTEYCVVQLEIDKTTAATRVSLLAE